MEEKMILYPTILPGISRPVHYSPLSLILRYRRRTSVWVIICRSLTEKSGTDFPPSSWPCMNDAILLYHGDITFPAVIDIPYARVIQNDPDIRSLVIGKQTITPITAGAYSLIVYIIYS